MELKNQCCSLSQAKRLKELGVKQKSYCYYKEETLFTKDDVTDWGSQYQFYQEFLNASGQPLFDGIYSAFTVAELGEMLPTLDIRRYKSNNGRGQDYYWLEFRSQDWSDTNEASLLAKFIIHLLENNLLDATTIK